MMIRTYDELPWQRLFPGILQAFHLLNKSKSIQTFNDSADIGMNGVGEGGKNLRVDRDDFTEYEGVSWGQPSYEQAWSNVLSEAGGYPKNIQEYTEIFGDPGWIKGKSMFAENGITNYNAYMWLLQNTLDFRTSPGQFYTNKGHEYNKGCFI